MKYVPDTNIVTRLLSGDERVLAHLADVDPSHVGVLEVAGIFEIFGVPGRN